MFSKEMKYVDYNGNDRTETLYFNLNSAEIAKLEAKSEGGLKGYITRIMEEQDIGKIWDLFEKIVMLSYGKKMADGSFAKENGALAAKFSETKAYSDFMVWLLSNDGANAVEFVNHIIPNDAPAGANGNNVVQLNP